ncbi:MAG: TIGR02266 family protein [Polyangiaceae bacterium]
MEASGPSVPAEATDAAAKEPDGSERRTTPRLKMDLEVSLTSESHVFVGLMGDVSTGGVFVPTYELKPRGAIIEIEFTLPSGLVQVKGEVRWIREQSDHAPPGLGIAFVDLTDDVRERIEAFCRQRAPTYYDIESDG